MTTAPNYTLWGMRTRWTAIRAWALVLGLCLFRPLHLSASQAPAAQEVWETVSSENGITVQRVQTPGSNFLKFRGMGVVDAPLIDILALLQDVDKTQTWNKNSYANIILQRKSDTEVITHSCQKVPWPFEDRCFVLDVKLYRDDKNRSVTILGTETTHPNTPQDDGRTMMKSMMVKWYFRPMAKHKGQKTWVSFTTQGDPGGNIPSWLINFVSKYVPRKTIENIRREVKRGTPDPEFKAKYKDFQDWY